MRKIYLLGIGLLLFGSNSIAQYCTVGVGPTNTADSNLEAADLTGETTNILYTGCPGVTGVEDQTVQVADVIAGNLYTLNVTWGTCSANTYGSAMEAWIDFDGSQTFDAGESIGTGSFFFGDPALTQAYSFTVPLSALNGTHRLRCMHYEGGALPLDPCDTYAYGSVVDFSISISGGTSCGPATALGVSNTTFTSTDLTWTPDGSAVDHEVEWGFPGFTPGTGGEEGSASAVVGGTTNAAGLTAETNYEFYVMTNCGGSNSSWAGPFAFYTGYCTVSTDFTGDYISLFTTTGADMNVSYTATAQPAGSYADETASEIHSYETGSFDVNTEYVGGTNQVKVWVDFNNDFDFDDLGEELYFQTSAGTNNPTAGTITIPGGIAVGNYRLRVRSQWNNTPPSCGNVNYGSTIDYTLVINTPPSCLQPTLLTATNENGSSVEIGWQDNAGAPSWIIEYGAPGFTPGTGTEVLAATNPFVVTGLTDLTDYDFYVRAFCAVGDTSSFAGPISATTTLLDLSCTAGDATIIYSEDFEGGYPLDWTNSASAGTVWQFDGAGGTGSAGTGPSGAQSGVGFMYIEATGGGTGDTDTLFTPMIDMSSSNNEARLIFYWHMYGVNMGDLDVEISTDGSAWTNVFSQSGESQLDDTDPWSLEEIDLAPYTGGPMWVRFIGIRGAGFESDMAIDNISVESCITCPVPTALTSANTTETQTELTWTAGGTETDWIIEYGPAGFTPGSIDGTTVPSTNNTSEVVSGLLDNTDYDFYVYADCGAGDMSTPVGPEAITTAIFCDLVTGLAFEYASNDTVSITWTPAGLESAWNIEWGVSGFVPGAGNGTLTNVNNVPDTTFGVPAGGVFDFYVQNDCGMGVNNPWAGPITYISPIVNDSTCDAIAVPVDGSTTLYANVGATTQVGSTVTGFNTVWFTFVAPASGHVEIKTCGNDFNNMLEVYEGTDCSDFGTLAYVDGATGNPFTGCTFNSAGINLCGLTAGNTYWLTVGSESNGVTGTFPLTLTELPAFDAGTAVPTDVCEDNAAFDLFTTITGNLTTTGQWYITEALPGNEFSSLVNVVGAAPGDYVFDYVHTELCGADTVSTTITVIAAPNVGLGSTIDNGCNYNSVALFDGLSGSIDLGGTWYSAAGDTLAGSLTNLDGQAAGSYDYYYVVDNGVCAADTATVTVDVIDCAGISENTLVLEVYPNPVQDILTIQLMDVDANASVELFNLQGSLVSAPIAVNNSTVNVSMAAFADGVYILKVTSNGATQEVRVVKQ